MTASYEAPAASPTEYWRGRRSALIGGQIAGRWLRSAPLRRPGHQRRPSGLRAMPCLWRDVDERSTAEVAVIVVWVFRRLPGMFYSQVTDCRSSLYSAVPSCSSWQSIVGAARCTPAPPLEQYDYVLRACILFPSRCILPCSVSQYSIRFALVTKVIILNYYVNILAQACRLYPVVSSYRMSVKQEINK